MPWVLVGLVVGWCWFGGLVRGGSPGFPGGFWFSWALPPRAVSPHPPPLPVFDVGEEVGGWFGGGSRDGVSFD